MGYHMRDNPYQFSSIPVAFSFIPVIFLAKTQYVFPAKAGRTYWIGFRALLRSKPYI